MYLPPARWLFIREYPTFLFSLLTVPLDRKIPSKFQGACLR